MKRIRSVSLFASDLNDIPGTLARLRHTGIKTIHFDVMDGKFVANTALGEEHYKQIDRKYFEVNVHLMVADPEDYVRRYIKLRPDAITFHCEAKDEATNLRLIKEIKDAGIKAGIAISPQSSLVAHKKEINASDFITFMSVTPGFNGQPFIPESPKRLAELRKLDPRPELEIEIDGGMRVETVPLIKDYVNYYVFGSAYFKQPDWNVVDQQFAKILA